MSASFVQALREHPRTTSNEEVLKFKKALRVERSKNQLFGGLPPCEKKQIKWRKFIDSGSYGFVYKGGYNKRSVAINVLKAGMKENSAENIPKK